MNGEGFTWSFDSALWQLEHGEAGTDRTNSAADYLTGLIRAGQPEVTEVIALNLLTLAERLRAAD